MIKKVQFRGISRVPSDVITSDGGCSESLNVYLDNNEIAPMLAPKDVTSELGIPTSNTNRKCVFVHKFGTVEKYIHLRANGSSACYVEHYVSNTWTQITSLNCAMADVTITNIGKTIIISGSSEVHYAIYQTDTGLYKYLGTQIPHIDVSLTNADCAVQENTIQGSTSGYISATDYPDVASISNRPYGSANNLYVVSDKGLVSLNILWTAVNAHIAKEARVGNLIYPSLFRVALRLYDDSLFDISPILMVGGKGGKTLAIHVGNYNGDDGNHTEPENSLEYVISSYNHYRVLADVTAPSNINDWSDVIKAVEVYTAGQVIPNMELNTAKSATYSGLDSSFIKTNCSNYVDVVLDPYHQNGGGEEEELLCNYSVFYRLKSYELDNLPSMEQIVEDFTGENLYVQLKLSDEGLPHQITPNNPYTFNARLLASGAKRILSHGYGFPMSQWAQNTATDSGTQYKYLVRYYIRTDDGDKIVYSAASGQTPSSANPVVNFVNYSLTPQNGRPCGTSSSSSSGNANNHRVYPVSELNRSRAYAWISYPDTRCYKADIFAFEISDTTQEEKSSYYWRSVTMKEFPNNNCAYGFLGYGTEWKASTATAVATADTGMVVEMAESRTENLPNIVFQSEANNPWVFPILNNRTLQANVIGVAPITTALSTGQHGSFNLYAFTEDGIFAFKTATDGTLGTADAVTRDIAKAGTIVAIDNAIVFTSDKGVMLLTGSEVTCLSPNMNGKHYSLDSTLRTLIGTKVWNGAYPVDDTPFMSFINNAKAIYDYAGSRLVFFNASKTYQYVYSFASQTWHKMHFPISGVDFVFSNTLNSHPEALVCGKFGTGDSANYGIVSVTTFLNSALEVDSTYVDPTITSSHTFYNMPTTTDQKTLPGIIVTRAVVFDSDYIYKTIERLKIRGIFIPGHVKYVLLASNDGRSYHVINSLRGPSWKFFRMIILTNMRPLERISYAECDVSSRFVNKER